MEKEVLKDLLLEDYRYRAESLKVSEASGETRFNIFVGLVTLVSGGLVALSTSQCEFAPYIMTFNAMVAMLILWVLGWFTWLRLMKRNKHTDECKYSLDHIRQTYMDHFDEGHDLKNYFPVGRAGIAVLKKSKPLKLQRGLGGLMHLMITVNAILAGAAVFFMVSMVIQERLLFVSLGASLVAALVSFILQLYLSERRALKDRRERELGMITHAGGIVYRRQEYKIHYLLITSNDPKKDWVFPKGHLEKDERHKEAALREVDEETGIVAKVIAPIDEIVVPKEKNGEYKSWNRIKFYLMEALHTPTTSPESRELMWLVYEDALKKLSYPESKRLLIKAHDLLQKLG